MPSALLLRGFTKKGRELIQKHGRSWTILETRAKISMSNNAGPWHLCVPTSALSKDAVKVNLDLSRWINEKGDTNFIVDHVL